MDDSLLHENSPTYPLLLQVDNANVGYLGMGLFNLTTTTNIVDETMNAIQLNNVTAVDIQNNTYFIKASALYQRHPIVDTLLCAENSLVDSLPQLPNADGLEILDLGRIPYVRMD